MTVYAHSNIMIKIPKPKKVYLAQLNLKHIGHIRKFMTNFPKYRSHRDI